MTSEIENEGVGYIKFVGSAVEDGAIGADAAGNSLLALDELIRYFNRQQSKGFSSLPYEITVKTHPDQGKNRTRRPLSFTGLAHARGSAVSCAGATLLVRLSPGRSDRLLPVRSGVEPRGVASPGQAIAACSLLLAGRCTIGCRSQASAS